MPAFRVSVTGRNFWLPVNGRLQRLGFSVALVVEADDEHDAETLALERLGSEPKLQGTQNDPSDPPEVSLEEVRRVETKGASSRRPELRLVPDDKDVDA